MPRSNCRPGVQAVHSRATVRRHRWTLCTQGALPQGPPQGQAVALQPLPTREKCGATQPATQSRMQCSSARAACRRIKVAASMASPSALLLALAVAAAAIAGTAGLPQCAPQQVNLGTDKIVLALVGGALL